MSKFVDILGAWINSFSIGDKTSGDKKLKFFGSYISELVSPSTLTAARTWTLPNQSGTLAIAAGSSTRLYSELLTVSAINTLSALTYTPDNNYNIQIIVNGKSESIFTNAFIVSGNAVVWSASSAGYNIETSFEVVARYTTLS